MMKTMSSLCFALILAGGSAMAQENSEDTKSDGFKQETLAQQVLLDRVGFSTGEIDGIHGRNVEEITKLFQEAAGLEVTGTLTDQTSATLMQTAGAEPILRDYTITEEDAAGPFTKDIPDDLEKQAKLDRLGYKNLAELLGEKFHVEPDLLKTLNNGSEFKAGQKIRIPNVQPPPIGNDGMVQKDKLGGSSSDAGNKEEESDEKESAQAKDGNPGTDEETPDQEQQSANASGETSATAEMAAAGAQDQSTTGTGTSQASSTFQPNRKPSGDITITVTKSTSVLVVEDEDSKPVFAAPVTTGSERDPLPIGEWKVNGTEFNPPFSYNPELFWDAKPSDEKAKIPPGANGPVGVAWIDITKEHYGLHGTPEPGKIGHTASHGCVRLTNWDVLRLSEYAKPNTKVIFRETENDQPTKQENSEQ